MKKTILVFSIFVLAFALAMTSSGCAGLFLWEKGKFYHSEVMDSTQLAAKDIRTVGVYAFSDGDAIEDTWGLSMSYWPSEVTKDMTFDPDTSLSGPSLELATDVAKMLNEKGYNAKAVTDLGHNREISSEDVLKHAQSKGYDGAMIVYYKAIKGWREDVGSSRSGNTITVYYTSHGFLYVPNATFFEAKTGDQIWKNCYYGMVENAHLFNFSNSSFTKLVPETVNKNDEETYIKAAPVAAKCLLEPELFPGTTKTFPSKGEKKHRM